MQILPIVERELRVAAHQPRTWWRRGVVLVFGLAVFVFIYLVVGQWAALSQIGKEIFNGLGGFALIYALLAGPLATVDCLSRERREGTLGLLFLTNLRSYDVVLGKVAAASFDMVLGLIAALPLLALPMLMGGITLASFARLALALGNLVFFSLSIGVCISAFALNPRTALVLGVSTICFLTLGPPFVLEGIGSFSHTSTLAAFCYLACPLYTFELCLAAPFREPIWKFWLNMGGLQAVAWICLTLASFRSANAWRDLPTSASTRRWRARIDAWKRGRPRARLRWRRLMLDKNPIRWMEGRDHAQERCLWALFLGIVIYFAAKRLCSPDTWPSNDFITLWPWWAQNVLCLWIALQAPRRLADDKQSGALELLLCTPLSTAAIVRGNMRALQRRYGRVFFGLLILDAFVVFAHFSNNGGWEAYRQDESFGLSLWALVVFPLQAFTMARVGLYQGLLQANSLRASFVSVWKVGLLPWISFFVLIVACEQASRRFKSIVVNDTVGFGVWAAAHILLCTIFLIRANRGLKHRFRVLALTTDRAHWWQRLRKTLRVGL